MASSSACNRLIQRASPSSSSVRSAVGRITCTTSSPSYRINSASSPLPNRSVATSLLRRFCSSRSAAELGCVQSLLPLHSAVAVARMTSCLSVASRNCRALSQDGIDDDT